MRLNKVINFSRDIIPTITGTKPAFVKRWGLLLFLFTAFIGLLLALPKAHAAKSNQQEYEIKAAFIYNFAKYVTWPKETFVYKNKPLVLGILGHNPFGRQINKIDGKLVHDRKLKVIAIKDYEQIKQCNMLYISPSESKNLDKIWPLLETEKILTISDMDNFAGVGGMIELIVKDDRIRFIINPQAAERAGLSISSQLLKLAIIFKQGS